MKDPIGQAILDYAKTGLNRDIIVHSDICEDDVIPSEYLFRSYDEMPRLEQIALENCKGKTLDIGAAAGIHAKYLQKNKIDVECIDISPLSVEYLQKIGLPARCINFFDLKNEKFDTLLLLMNGIGIAGQLSNLQKTLEHAKSLLTENGQIICDSSDVKFLFEDEDGSLWVDLNSAYYGNFKFVMEYENHQSDEFDWLYVDYSNFKRIAENSGLIIEKLYDKNDQFLVVLTQKTEQ